MIFFRKKLYMYYGVSPLSDYRKEVVCTIA